MALLCSIATGNAGDASTWGVVDATSYLGAEISSTTLTNTGSDTRSSAFTPGAITISHIGVKLAVRGNTIGTVSVRLVLSSDNSEVAGTLVTIDLADFPSAVEVDKNGGWVLFKLASPVTLANVAHKIEAYRSTGSVSLWQDSTSDNISRILVTTTTAAPAAGDNMIVVGEKTGSGTGNDFTVTWDITASTDFGSAPTAANALLTPGIAVCNGGTLQSGTTAATHYVMKLSNSLIVYSGGTVNFGTSGTPIPSGGSFTLTFDCGTNVDYGLVVRNLGTWNAYGTKGFTSSPSNHFTIMTADKAAGDSSIDVLDTTGWEVGDEVIFTSTSRTITEHEMKVIATVPSSTNFTLTAGGSTDLDYAHSGTNDANGDIRCRVGNLTRNITIQGASVSLCGYVYCLATATVTLRKVAFKWIGSSTSTKRGIEFTTTTGSFDMQYCVLRNFEVSGSYGLMTNGSNQDNYTISNNVWYRVYNGFYNLATTGTWTMSYNLVCATFSNGVSLNDVGGVFTYNFINCTGTSTSGTGILISESTGLIGTFSNNDVCCTNGNPGIYIVYGTYGEISDCRVYRCNSANASSCGWHITGGTTRELRITNLIAFGNNSRDVGVTSGIIRLVNPSIQAGSTITSTTGLNVVSNLNSTFTGSVIFLTVENGAIGTVNSYATGDLQIFTSQYAIMQLHNTSFGSSVTLYQQNALPAGSTIISLKHNGTVGDNRTWKGGGRSTGAASLMMDATIYRTASPSLAMYPGSASIKLESSTWEVAVASGTTLTPSVYVRESVVGDGTDYNGNRIRLCVKRHVAAGISADTVIATATSSSEGAWELISGTTVSVTDDAILEFFVDCDGTTGWVNVDDFSCVGVNPNGMKYWSPNHAGPLTLGLPAGGGLIGGGNISGGLQ